jgi:two-component system cell cycle response regulator DivK
MTTGIKTILIADDKAAGRDLLRTVLESSGYNVLQAADGREAIDEAHAHRPDLIILDLHMPDVDGFGVIRTLRGEEDFASTPVVALTASAMQGDRERAMEAGFTGYLTKPIRLSDLRREVERLLR